VPPDNFTLVHRGMIVEAARGIASPRSIPIGRSSGKAGCCRTGPRRRTSFAARCLRRSHPRWSN